MSIISLFKRFGSIDDILNLFKSFILLIWFNKSRKLFCLGFLGSKIPKSPILTPVNTTSFTPLSSKDLILSVTFSTEGLLDFPLASGIVQ